MKDVPGLPEEEKADSILFLGTGGARFVVATQVLASGGAWFDLGGTQILIDPGPGCLVHAVKKKLDPRKLSAIVLSHKHLDHSGDINVMIEAMTDGGHRQHGTVFAPQDALGPDAVILSYLRSFPKEIRLFSAGGRYQIGEDVFFTTPVRHQHPVETYGFIFETPRHTFSWITDTRYSDELAASYRGEVLILNVVRMDSSLPIDHLSIPEARLLIEAIKPKTAILTHFGMTVFRARPWEVAARLTQDTGIQVVAARDGMKFQL